MKKRLVSILVALCMICAFLPTNAFAAWSSNYTLTGNQAQDIVNVAVAQAGKNGQDLNYGNVAWCAYFVCDCAKKANVNGIPHEGVASSMFRKATQNGLEGNYFTDVTSQNSSWTGGNGGGMQRNYDTQYCSGMHSSNWTPQKGDLVFFTRKGTSTIYHVGIVQNVSGNTIYVVHGNWSSKVVANYAITRGQYHSSRSGDYAICAYVRPNYSGQSQTPTPCTTHTKGNYLWCELAHPHYNYFTCSVCGATFTDGTTDTLSSCAECTSAPTNQPQYFDCNVRIHCVNGQVVNLYKNPGDKSRVDYFKRGQSPYSVYGARLSDGSTWYKISAYSVVYDTSMDYWLKYESDKMTVENIPKSYTVNFNANGGSTPMSSKIVHEGETYGDLPFPTRTGYNFDGWYTASIGGTQITYATAVNLSEPQITLYAHWTAAHTTHTWDGGIITKQPTLKDTGIKTYTCTVCKETKTESIGVLTSYTIPYGTTEIKDCEFLSCHNLTTITIPNSVTRIGTAAFQYTGLTSIAIPASVKKIDEEAFRECTSLSSVTISNGVNEIGMGAFLGCTSLSSIIIPNSITEINSGTFFGCTGLTNITIPDSVTKIDARAFKGSINLKNVYYGGSEAQWKAIAIGDDNDPLKNATIHFTECTIHTWDGGVITEQPTFDSTGIKTYTCTVCKTTRTETIPALPASTTPTSGSLQNFVAHNVYYNGLFRDVAANAWYANNVSAVYQLGLMNGTGANTFAPKSNITIAQAVTLAARLHSIYYTGKEMFETYDGGNWYDSYVNYARSNGIISENYNFSQPATREIFAHILAQALPADALQPIRSEPIQFADAGSIVYAGDVNLLCQAGVINGVQSGGATNFLPQNTITRAEASAIVTRMAQPGLRMA